MTLPAPTHLLGVPGYMFWYPGQEASFKKIMDWVPDSSRFLGVAAPTGSGKSMLALLVAKMTGARTLIVTATKGLQNQYIREAQNIGGVNVVGQNNFPCNLVPSLRADEGPCHEGTSCPLRSADGCPYQSQLRTALRSRIVITNYAYYLAQTNYSSGLGDFGLVVLDEAHMAFSAMENYLTIYISKLDIEPMGVFFPKAEDGAIPSWGAWRSWAGAALTVAEETVSSIEADVKDRQSQGDAVPGHLSRSYRSARSVVAHLGRLSAVSEQWVIQRTHHGFRFVPTWVDNYAAELFQETPKVMLMSAILSHKTCDYLGVPVKRSWLESPSYFPAANTPMWHIPTVRVNHRIDDYGVTLWASRVDQIIQRRMDRKGIVFTVSYERARELLRRSRFKDIMLTHSTGDVMQVVDRFKSMNPPAVLVSPTVTTGWDFAGSQCEYIIVGKLPYPDTRDEVTQVRQKEDKDWASYLTMNVLVQECGRGSRSSTDKCEVLIIDDLLIWFWAKYKNFAPLYFQNRYRGSLQTVPDPLV